MAAGSLGVLQRNLLGFPGGVKTLLSQAPKAFAVQKTIWDRQAKLSPWYFRDGAEVFYLTQKSYLDPNLHIWVDRNLHEAVSWEDIHNFVQFKVDVARLAPAVASVGLTAGYGVLSWPFWLGNNSYSPSVFSRTPEDLANWREAQDLQRYRYAHAYLNYLRGHLEGSVGNVPAIWTNVSEEVSAKNHKGWEHLFNFKNNTRRDELAIKDLDEFFRTEASFWRYEIYLYRNMLRTMNFSPALNTTRHMQHRILTFWNDRFNEDWVLKAQKGGADGLTDEQLYEYANARLLAPYDAKLSRRQILDRVAQYNVLTQEVVKSSRFFDNPPSYFALLDKYHDAPLPEVVEPVNTILLHAFVCGFYNEPGYLEMDAQDIQLNDFPLQNTTKELFQARLAFENGPLRDQVEVHSQRVIASNKKTGALIE